MAFTNSPGIVTSNLIYYHDVNNRKSYAGPPISNSLSYTYPTPVGTGTATGYSSTSGSEIVNIPSLGPTTTYYNLIQNNYTSFAPNSTNCCPSLFQYGSMAVTGSTLYTYGIVYKCDSGYTGANFMYRYEYNGGTYVTESGVFNSASQVALGDGWFYMLATFTTQATTTTLSSTGLWYYQYSPYVDKISVAKIMITPGNYTGLHPKYWPAMNTTRASTAVVNDLANNNTWTANNLSYSGNIFSFNGSSSWLESPTSSLYDLQAFTMESWCNPTTTSQSGFLFEKGQVNTQYSNFFDAGGNFYFRTIGLSPQDLTFTAASYITANAWNHIVCTYGGGTKTIYVNGVQVAQTTGITGNLPTGQTNQYIGKYGAAGNNYPFSGQIGQSRVYNRALTAAEVTQNYNAHRGIYGR